ncbi:MAG TPA: MOSC domain-containing protein [Limnochordia bacterium]|nr:MOSC domain-containing protein [Limnochordia bacterium]
MDRVRSVNVGLPAVHRYLGDAVLTGIFKAPSPGPHRLTPEGVRGDGQGDLVGHAGPDKAVCVYSFDRYALWRAECGLDFTAPGAFGENLTVDGLDDDAACLGDVWQVGTAVLQVTQPRQPCYKLSLRWGVDELPERVRRTGYSGYYLRVVEPGEVQAGDPVTVVERHPDGVCIRFANQVIHDRAHGEAGLQRVLAVAPIALRLRKQLQKRLDYR